MYKRQGLQLGQHMVVGVIGIQAHQYPLGVADRLAYLVDDVGSNCLLYTSSWSMVTNMTLSSWMRCNQKNTAITQI